MSLRDAKFKVALRKNNVFSGDKVEGYVYAQTAEVLECKSLWARLVGRAHVEIVQLEKPLHPAPCALVNNANTASANTAPKARSRGNAPSNRLGVLEPRNSKGSKASLAPVFYREGDCLLEEWQHIAEFPDSLWPSGCYQFYFEFQLPPSLEPTCRIIDANFAGTFYGVAVFATVPGEQAFVCLHAVHFDVVSDPKVVVPSKTAIAKTGDSSCCSCISGRDGAVLLSVTLKNPLISKALPLQVEYSVANWNTRADVESISVSIIARTILRANGIRIDASRELLHQKFPGVPKGSAVSHDSHHQTSKPRELRLPADHTGCTLRTCVAEMDYTLKIKLIRPEGFQSLSAEIPITVRRDHDGQVSEVGYLRNCSQFVEVARSHHAVLYRPDFTLISDFSVRHFLQAAVLAANSPKHTSAVSRSGDSNAVSRCRSAMPRVTGTFRRLTKWASTLSNALSRGLFQPDSKKYRSHDSLKVHSMHWSSSASSSQGSDKKPPVARHHSYNVRTPDNRRSRRSRHAAKSAGFRRMRRRSPESSARNGGGW